MHATADWRIMLTLLLTGTFEVSSILHVALLVYFRLISILQPLIHNEGIIARRNYLLASIWILIVSNNSLRFIFFVLDMRDGVDVMDSLNFWVLVVTPATSILLFYVLLVFFVRQKKQGNECHMSIQVQSAREEENDRTTKIVMRLVVTLLFCYVPYIALLNGLHSKVSNMVSSYHYITHQECNRTCHIAINPKSTF